MDFAGLVPRRHAVREPDQGSTARHRPLQDHRVGPQPPVRAREEQPVRHPRNPRGEGSSGSRRSSSSSREHQAQDVITGELDFMADPPPPDLKREVTAKYSDRYEEHVDELPPYYLFMNVRVPPFDEKKVREAVNYGVDKRALARLFAGELAPGCSFLPPGIPGYDRALDVEDCPWGNPNEPPDLAKARQLIDEAGAKGAEVTVWGGHPRPRRRDRPGLRRHAQQDRVSTPSRRSSTPPSSARRSATRGPRRRRVSPHWFQDFPHPKNFFFRVSGDVIQPTNNQNFGNVDDPEITSGIAELSREPELTEEVAGRWGELNRQLVEEGWIVPFGHRSSRPSCPSGWTSRTAPGSTRSTTTTIRASASSSWLRTSARGAPRGARRARGRVHPRAARSSPPDSSARGQPSRHVRSRPWPWQCRLVVDELR